MENHAAASMYIPSSKVLARLQRHSASSSSSAAAAAAAGSSGSASASAPDATGRSGARVALTSASPLPARSPASAASLITGTQPVTTITTSRPPQHRDASAETHAAPTSPSTLAAPYPLRGGGSTGNSSTAPAPGSDPAAAPYKPSVRIPASRTSREQQQQPQQQHGAGTAATTPAGVDGAGRRTASASATPPIKDLRRSPQLHLHDGGASPDGGVRQCDHEHAEGLSGACQSPAGSAPEATMDMDAAAPAADGAAPLSSSSLSPPPLPHTSSSPSSSAAAVAAWLVPREDFAYVLSSLTWNVDLLRLLLPHAPCPLHLPADPSQKDAIDAQVPGTAAHGSATPEVASTKPAERPEESESAVDATAAAAAATVAARAEEGVAADDNVHPSGRRAAAAVMKGSGGRGNEPAAAGVSTLPESTASSCAKRQLNRSTSPASTSTNDEESVAAAEALPATPPAPEWVVESRSPSKAAAAAATAGNGVAPGAAVSTPPLTWSQYLFKGNAVGAGTGTDGSQLQETSAQQQPQQMGSALSVRGLGAALRTPPMKPAAWGSTRPHGASQLTLPLSTSAAAATAAAKVAVAATVTTTTMTTTPTATATNSSATTTSIFQAQYCPSLEEFQRQLEQQKQQQLLRQQRQQTPPLSATRLQQHLLFQQQQEQHEQQQQPYQLGEQESLSPSQPSSSQHHPHLRRRAATNRTFFYSPTPSVRSAATGIAHAVDRDDDDDDDEHRDGSDDNDAESAAATAAVARVCPPSPAPSPSAVALARVRRLQAATEQQRAARRVASHASRTSGGAATTASVPPAPLRGNPSSLSSLDCLAAGSGTANSGGDGGVDPGSSFSPSRASYAGSLSSRPSSSQPQPHSYLHTAATAPGISPAGARAHTPHHHMLQPSLMMLRAAEQIGASIIGSARPGNVTATASAAAVAGSAASLRPSQLLIRNGALARQMRHHSSRSLSHITPRSRGVAAEGDNHSVGGADNGNAVAHDRDDVARGSRSSSSRSSSSGGAEGDWQSCPGSSTVGAWPAGSFPASPTVSLGSVSLSRVWSSNISGRVTPRTTASFSGRFNSSSISARAGGYHGTPSSLAQHGGSGGGGGGGGNARRRRKATCTRHQRTMQVYMPSITEGPKASILYTAPTAEAQELLLQLQHRAATAAAAAPVGGPSAGGRPHTDRVSAAPPSTHATPKTYAMVAASTRLAPRHTTAPLPPASLHTPPLHPNTAPAPPRPSTFAEAARAKYTGPRDRPSPLSTPPQKPSPAPANPASGGGDGDTTPPAACLPSAVTDGGGGGVARLPPTGAHGLPVAEASASAASALPTGATVATAATVTSTMPRSGGSLGNGQWGGSGGSDASSCGVADLHGSAEVKNWTDATAAPCDAALASADMAATSPLSFSASTSLFSFSAFVPSVQGRSTPETPVELPRWVRERPLSALYYQPWGLELLARYEAARHEQQLMRTRMLRRVGATASPTVTTNTTPVLASVALPCATKAGGPGVSPSSLTVAGRHAPVLSPPSLGTTSGVVGGSALSPAAQGAAAASSAYAARSVSTSAAASSEAAAAAAAPPISAAPRVSWAAAVRQPALVRAPGSSATAPTSTTTTSSLAGVPVQPATANPTTTVSKITATTTMNNSTMTTTPSAAAGAAARTALAVIPGWPPELSAAEERDAWEEAYYFGRLPTGAVPGQHPAQRTEPVLQERTGRSGKDGAVAVSPTTELGARNVALPVGTGTQSMGDEGAGGGGGVTGSSSATAAVTTLMRQRWWMTDDIQLPTLYLSRQRRCSRRRSRAAYPSDTTRSSTARRAGVTSAAAELRHQKRRDAAHREHLDGITAFAEGDVSEDAKGGPAAHTAAGAAVTPEELSAGGLATPAAAATTITGLNTNVAAPGEDLMHYGDRRLRKKASQLLYPDPMGGGAGSFVGVAAAAALARSPTCAIPGLAALAAAHGVVDVDGGGSGSGGGDVADAYPHHPPPQEDAEEASPGCHRLSTSTGEALRSASELGKLADGARAVVAAVADAADNSAAAAAVSEAADGEEDGHTSGAERLADGERGRQADSTTASVGVQTTRTSPPPPLPPPEIDVIFFLQKFLRAMLIVVVVQVRLQAQQRQRERQQQQQQQHARVCHSLMCPAGTFQLELQTLEPLHTEPTVRSRIGCGVDVGDGGVLSKVERSALRFVRHHMADYRQMITAYVMRSEGEVARRSMQAIFSDSVSQTSSSSTTAQPSPCSPPPPTTTKTTASDPLFEQEVLARGLGARRVTDVYNAAVATAMDTSRDMLPGSPPSTPLDDVEALRTAQVYIGGKDAAWQPLLIELMEVSRVVQCYSDGPGAAGGASSSATAPPAAVASTSASPQRALLASLECFLAQPTVPLLRAEASTATTSITTSTTMSLSTRLSAVQAAAAAGMTEESDVYKEYLLDGYLRDRGEGPSSSAPQHPSALTAPSVTSVLEPLTWYPYAYMPGTANPYAESGNPYSTRITAAQAAAASAMTLFVTTLPLSGRLLWRWVVPAEDTDAFNLSVFFQSSLFSFMQGGPLPPPSPAPPPSAYPLSTGWGGGGATAPQLGGAFTGHTPPVMSFMANGTATTAAAVASLSPPPHPSLTWPPALARTIDMRLRRDALWSAWGGAAPVCTCGACPGGAALSRVGDNSSSSAVDVGGRASEVDVDGASEVTLVHCSAGMHRSCGILVAFLLWLLYQCRQVLTTEEALGMATRQQQGGRRQRLQQQQQQQQQQGHGAVSATMVEVAGLLLDGFGDAPLLKTSPGGNVEEGAGADGHLLLPPLPGGCGGGAAAAVVAGEDAPWVTSRLLLRAMRHVQQQRRIAVPIRTVQCLLQSFATELQLK